MLEATAPLVLMADDHEDTTEMLGAYLAAKGFRFEAVKTGLRALERAFKTLPSVILTDLRLPVLDGWEFTRRIKRDKRTAMIPVLVLTGLTSEEAVLQARDSGCTRYLVKPCQPDHVVQEIESVLRGDGPASPCAIR